MLGDVCRLAIGRMDSFAPPPLSKWRYEGAIARPGRGQGGTQPDLNG